MHLKLNYDTNAALTQIQAKVAQVRNDLPPEAQAPIIDLQTADSQFAAMYLGFASEDLDQNQITDYLVRVVQPKLTAVSGVQRADILGDRTFAMRVWLKPDRMASLGISPSQVRDALAANNYLSALGKTKGSMVSVNLVANTNLKTAEEFRQLVVKEDKGVVVRLGEIADVVLGAENYDSDVRFNGQTATFMGIWALPTANSLEVVGRVREAMKEIQAQLPVGMTAGIPYDSTGYIRDAIREVLKTLSETLLIVIIVIFLFLGSARSVLIPVVAIPISLVGAVFLMLVAGFTINLLTLLAIVLSVGLVVDDAIVMVENVERHIQLGQRPLRRGGRRRAGARRTDHLDDDHAGGRLRPDRSPGRTDGLPLPGIRSHARGSGDHLRRRRADALADDELAPPAERGRRARLRRHGSTGTSSGFGRPTGACSSQTLAYRPVVLVLWAIVVLLIVPFYLFSQRELAPIEDQSVVFGIVQAAPNATLDQTRLFADQVNDVYPRFRRARASFRSRRPTGASAEWSRSPGRSRKKSTGQLQMETAGKLSQIPGVRVISLVPPALPGGGSFPVDFVIASTADPERLSVFANTLVQKAFASGLFMFADSDVKFDQPQTEVVFDRDKLRSQGVDLSEAGKDLSTMLGGNYVNRFSVQGRSYKVIPQIKRAERLTTDQLSEIYVTGAGGKLVPLSTFATLKTTTEPRELKRFQQLNAVHIQGVIPQGVSLDKALRFLEDEARQILPPGQGFAIDYAGESRQLRTEGGKFLRHVPALGDPDLPRAGGPVRELPRPLHHPGGLGAPGALGSAALLFPRADDAEHLQPGRPDHARRPDLEERHPDRRVRQQAPGEGTGQARRRDRSRGDATAPDPDDHGRHRHGPPAARLRAGSGRRGAQLDRNHARQRHDHRHGLHALRRAVDLRAPGQDPHRGRGERGRARSPRPRVEGSRDLIRSREGASGVQGRRSRGGLDIPLHDAHTNPAAVSAARAIFVTSKMGFTRTPSGEATMTATPRERVRPPPPPPPPPPLREAPRRAVSRPLPEPMPTPATVSTSAAGIRSESP